MKIFIYSTEYKKASYCSNVTVNIYQIKRNKPLSCGQVFFNTGSCMGVEHEINLHLIKEGFIPKSYGVRGGYINYDKFGENKAYCFYSI